MFISEIGQVFASQFGIEVTEVSQHIIRLTGQAPQTDYEEILGDVMYENVADEPGDITRRVLFSITDINDFVSTATTTVSILPTNDRAIITFVGGPAQNLRYDELTRSPINLFNESDTITDSDGNSLEWLTIHLTPGVDPNDALAASAGSTGLTVTVVAFGDGEILLNVSRTVPIFGSPGNAELALYESVLESVTFVNDFPGVILGEQRRIEVVTFDGETMSDVHPITITIDGYNDPPMCFFNEVVSLYGF